MAYPIPQWLITVFLAAAPLAAVPAAPGSRQPQENVRAAADRGGAEVVEMQAFRRSGVVSAWLSNGIRVHHRRMDAPPGHVEVVISFAGSELLECPDTRGLSLLSAAFLDHPVGNELSAAEGERRLRGRDVHIEGGVMPDALSVRIWGSAADIRAAVDVTASALRAPHLTDESLAVARLNACKAVERTHADPRWSVTEPLLDLMTPRGECRTKLACTERLAQYTPDQVKSWIVRHSGSETVEGRPCEVAIVGDIELTDALRMASQVFGVFPARPRAAPGALADRRCVAKPAGPFIRDVACNAATRAEETHVLAGFLSPDPCEVQEVRRLRAGARVLSNRLESRLRELKLGGDPHVSWTYLPSPFAGMSVTVVSARVIPGDAEPVKQIMQASMCELMDQGLHADELARSTEMLARVAAAYERDPRYWAAILARSTSAGLDPELVAEGAMFYRALKPDEVLAAMRRACTLENRLDLVVRPGPQAAE